METELKVFLTADIGPADAVLGAGHEIHGRWEETEAGLGVATDVLCSIADRFGISMPVTWFFRADSLIEQQFGDCLAIHHKFSRFVQQAILYRHEIAWMPQVYAGAYDGIAINYEDLASTHARLLGADMPPKSVRMGNCFHDNRSMRLLDELGIEIDSSAVPGRAKGDFGWRMDWRDTPAAAYHPSLADYRTPGTPQLGILEVPLSVRPIKAPYDSAPLLRYLNPCMGREFFWQNLGEMIAASPYLVLIFHPDEAVPPKAGRGHPLVAYSKEELGFNLSQLVERCMTMGRTLSFHKLEDFVVQLPVRDSGSILPDLLA